MKSFSKTPMRILNLFTFHCATITINLFKAWMRKTCLQQETMFTVNVFWFFCFCQILPLANVRLETAKLDKLDPIYNDSQRCTILRAVLISLHVDRFMPFDLFAS